MKNLAKLIIYAEIKNSASLLFITTSQYLHYNRPKEYKKYKI